MTPKISERPLPTRNSSAPYEMPLKAWVSQNCVFIPSPTPLRSRKPDELPYDGFGRPQAPWRDESHRVLGVGGRHRRFGLALVAAPCALLRCRFFRRNDRQQEIGLPLPPKCRLVTPPKTSLGRSRGSSCRNGPQPVSSFLKFDSLPPLGPA